MILFLLYPQVEMVSIFPMLAESLDITGIRGNVEINNSLQAGIEPGAS